MKLDIASRLLFRLRPLQLGRWVEPPCFYIIFTVMIASLLKLWWRAKLLRAMSTLPASKLLPNPNPDLCVHLYLLEKAWLLWRMKDQKLVNVLVWCHSLTHVLRESYNGWIHYWKEGPWRKNFKPQTLCPNLELAHCFSSFFLIWTVSSSLSNGLQQSVSFHWSSAPAKAFQ